VLGGQTEVEQRGIVGEVGQDNQTDPPPVGIDPLRDMVGISETALIDPPLHNRPIRPADRTKRELVTGQELDEVRPIAPAIVEWSQPDVHRSRHLPAERCRQADRNDAVVDN
jgi:hypothetical protein